MHSDLLSNILFFRNKMQLVIRNNHKNSIIVI